MAAPAVAAVAKKVIVYILTDKKALKTVLGIVLGIIIILLLPLGVIIGVLNGDVEIDPDRMQELIVQNLSTEEQAMLQGIEDTMYGIEDGMTNAGYSGTRVTEAQVLYVLALSSYSSEDGFVDKLVGCFTQDQSDEQLISAVNSAFGTSITTQDFSNVMSNIRNAYIDTSNYTDPKEDNGFHPFAVLTKSFGEFIGQKNCAYIDTNNCPFADQLLAQGIAIDTGLTKQSGFCTYPLWQFNEDFLKSADSEHYKLYSEGFDAYMESMNPSEDEGQTFGM